MWQLIRYLSGYHHETYETERVDSDCLGSDLIDKHSLRVAARSTNGKPHTISKKGHINQLYKYPKSPSISGQEN